MTREEIAALRALCDKPDLIGALDLAVGSIGPPYTQEYLKARQSICEVLARVPALLSALEEAQRERDRLQIERDGYETALRMEQRASVAAESRADALQAEMRRADSERVQALLAKDRAINRANKASARADAAWRAGAEAMRGIVVTMLRAEADAHAPSAKARGILATAADKVAGAIVAGGAAPSTEQGGPERGEVEAMPDGDFYWHCPTCEGACDYGCQGHFICGQCGGCWNGTPEFHDCALPPPSATPANEETGT